MMRVSLTDNWRSKRRGFRATPACKSWIFNLFDLPDGMKLAKASCEVLLRYVLLDVVAA
jgi:hypothetical protein